MAVKTKRQTENEKSGRLFGEISIETTSVRVEEFDHYTATVKAAEAFSKSVLIKSEKEVSDLINKITRNKFKVSDFTGGVKIGLFRHCANEIAFKVNFELSAAAKKRKGLIGPVQLTLTTGAKKIEDTAQIDISGSKEKSGLDVNLQRILEFEYQGVKYLAQTEQIQTD